MEIVQEVKVKQFNSLIKSGTPIQLRYTREERQPIIHAIVKENHGESLSYVCVASRKVIERTISIYDLQIHGIKIAVLETK